MGIISNFLFKHSKSYQEKHIVRVSYDWHSTQRCSNLGKIPYEKRTKEMCINAYDFVTYQNRKQVLSEIPSEYFNDYNFCLSLVLKSPEAMEYVPEKFKDEKMILASQIKHEKDEYKPNDYIII